MSSAKWCPFCLGLNVLTHWGRVTHICIRKLATIGSDNGLSPGRHQAIIWTNAGKLLVGPLGTNFSEISIENSPIFIQENAFGNVVCEMAAILSRLQWFKGFCVKIDIHHVDLLPSGYLPDCRKKYPRVQYVAILRYVSGFDTVTQWICTSTMWQSNVKGSKDKGWNVWILYAAFRYACSGLKLLLGDINLIWEKILQHYAQLPIHIWA